MEVAAIAMTEKEMLLDMFKLDNEALDMIHSNNRFEDWYRNSASFREILPLGQFKAKYDAGEVGNFVYYREGGVVFNTLVPANHSDFMAGLYNLHMLKKGMRQTGSAYKEWPRMTTMFSHDRWSGQDQFLKDGLGVYQSSCSRDMYRHQDHPLNGQERIVFGSLREHLFTY